MELARLRRVGLDLAFVLAVVLPVEFVKWILFKLAGADVLYVMMGFPLFILFYYKRIAWGLLGIAISVVLEFLLFVRPTGQHWYSTPFLSLTVFGVVVTPILIALAVSWRNALAWSKEVIRYQKLLIAGLGHDLKTPLASIMLSVQLLAQQDVKLDDKDVRASFRRMDLATRRMNAIVDQVLDLTRLQVAGALELYRKQMDLVPMIQEVIEEAKVVVPEADIKFLHDVPQILGSWDEARLQRTLANLLANAWKYGDKTSPITVLATERPEMVSFSVRNHGPAIPRHMLPVLFDPFERAASVAGGLGLGLYIVSQMVEKHGGAIDVKSDDNGTVFTVMLPRYPGFKILGTQVVIGASGPPRETRLGLWVRSARLWWPKPPTARSAETRVDRRQRL